MLSAATKKRIEASKIDQDAYLAMLEYAKYLPHGKRQLQLDFPKLREMLVSTDLEETPLTKRSGLNSGGMVAQHTPPKLELLSQREHLFSILNKNKSPDKPAPTYCNNNIHL